MRNRRTIPRIMPLALTAGLLTGCMANPEDPTPVQSTIRIMSHSQESFSNQYGQLFSAVHPNIDVEIVPLRNIDANGVLSHIDIKDFDAWMEEHRPDVLLLNAEQYKKLSGEGKLVDLEAYAAKDKYDLDGIVPALLSYTRELSGGRLYGLPPTFHSQAIYYNKDLFTKYGVPFPEDRMSWDQILQLAARFPADEGPDGRIYGLSMASGADLFGLVETMAMTQGLSWIDASLMKVTVKSPAWLALFEAANEALRSEALYTESGSAGTGYLNQYLQNPFVGRKAAMAFENDLLLSTIRQAQDAAGDQAVTNWDLVTAPVNPLAPGETTSVTVGDLFAIPADSPNIEAAWQFISYVTGDEFARVKSGVSFSGFAVRTAYLTDDESRNYKAFYDLSPVETSLFRDFDKVPNAFWGQFFDLLRQQLQFVTDGRKTVQEALDEVQSQGQQMLDNAK